MEYDFQEISREEYLKRLRDLRSVMDRRGLDAIILTEEENIRWVSGYWVFTMQDGAMNTAVIIPHSESAPPRLILTSESTGEGLSRIEDIKYWEEDSGSYLEADKGTVLFKNLADIAGSRVKRIGMELGSGMKINLGQKDIDIFRKNLKPVSVEDISAEILGLRSIKSGSEIKKLRSASDITCRSIKQAFSEIKPGITERSLGQAVGRYFFEYGATGVGHIGVGFGRAAIGFAHSDPKEYPLEKGTLAKVDAGCSVEGYRCDMYRMACMDGPDKEEARIAGTIARANMEVIGSIREGTSCSSLYKIAEDVFESRGFSRLLSPTHYIGHGIGLGVHEPPYIYRGSRDILSAGMVLTIEPWTYHPEKPEYSMNIEDVVLVTGEGAEILTPMDREIYIV